MSYLIDEYCDQVDSLTEYYEGVAKTEGFQSEWGMWTADEWIDMNDLSGISKGTKIRLLIIKQTRDGKCSFDKTSATVEGETWLDVWRACDKLICESGDTLNISVEDLTWTTIEQPDGTSETFLDLITC